MDVWIELEDTRIHGERGIREREDERQSIAGEHGVLRENWRRVGAGR